MTIEILRDTSGKIIGECHNGDPQHPESWRILYNDQGEKIGELWGEDSENLNSWVYIYGEDGKPTHWKYGDGRVVMIA